MGGEGDDLMYGGSRDDLLEGGAGNDSLYGEHGDDTATYANDPSAVYVNLEQGIAYDGYGGTDLLDTIENAIGSAFDDTLIGDRYVNRLTGGAGDDTLIGGAGADTLDGGLGSDMASYFNSPGAVNVNLKTGSALLADAQGDKLISIENLTGSDFDDTLTGDDGNNQLLGLGGDDTLEGGLGNDILIGDTLHKDTQPTGFKDCACKNGCGSTIEPRSGSNDTYRFHQGDGQDIIRDLSTSYRDTLFLGTGFAPDDLLFFQPSGAPNSLGITFTNSPTDQILIEDQFLGFAGVESIQFASGIKRSLLGLSLKDFFPTLPGLPPSTPVYTTWNQVNWAIGNDLQVLQNKALIDLRDYANQLVTIEFAVSREAGYDNFVGFYVVDDEDGKITDPVTGAVLTPGQAGYTTLALKNRLSGIDLTASNLASVTLNAQVTGGAILAPFIVANGVPDLLFDTDLANDPAVYFSFAEANTDRTHHICVLDNNRFGFEDLPNGGDKDYNDILLDMHISIGDAITIDPILPFEPVTPGLVSPDPAKAVPGIAAPGITVPGIPEPSSTSNSSQAGSQPLAPPELGTIVVEVPTPFLPTIPAPVGSESSNDSVFMISDPTDPAVPELLDLRAMPGERTFTFTVQREAAFNNTVGLYVVENQQGAVRDTFGNLVNPGDAGYSQAAILRRVEGLGLSTANQTTTTTSFRLQAGSILAPFIIANGTVDQLLDGNSTNDPAVYFPFLGANPGGTDHVRLLANNTLGFEDMPNGGDADYNDLVVQISAT